MTTIAATQWTLYGAFIAGAILSMFVTMIIVGAAVKRELSQYTLIPKLPDDTLPDDVVVRLSWPTESN